jgi:hypothetical protein
MNAILDLIWLIMHMDVDTRMWALGCVSTHTCPAGYLWPSWPPHNMVRLSTLLK